MATNRGTHFKSLVADLINLDVRKKERYERAKEFLLKSEEYYDVFCDNIYIFTLDGKIESLSIDENGLTHSYNHEKNMITLLTRDDYNPKFTDISIYIDIALSRLENAKMSRIKENMSNVDIF